jgi:hypothetical protein
MGSSMCCVLASTTLSAKDLEARLKVGSMLLLADLVLLRGHPRKKSAVQVRREEYMLYNHQCKISRWAAACAACWQAPQSVPRFGGEAQGGMSLGFHGWFVQSVTATTADGQQHALRDGFNHS